MTSNSTNPTAKKATCDRVLKEVLQIEDNDDPMFKAFDMNGIKSIKDILTMLETDISGLKYKPTNSGKLETIPLHSRNLLHILKAWNCHIINLFKFRNVNWDDNMIIIVMNLMATIPMCMTLMVV